MICPKCGNECGDSNFCPKCGTRLVKTCRNCHKVLEEGEVFCSACGTDNSKKEKAEVNTCGVIGFVMTLVIAVLQILKLSFTRGMFSFYRNGFFFRLPFFYIELVFAFLYLALIVFSVIYRASKKGKGWGITAMIFAFIIVLLAPFRISSLLLAVSTIMAYSGKKN